MISGSPAFDNRIWLRAVTIFQRLPELLKRLDRLKKSWRLRNRRNPRRTQVGDMTIRAMTIAATRIGAGMTRSKRHGIFAAIVFAIFLPALIFAAGCHSYHVETRSRTAPAGDSTARDRLSSASYGADKLLARRSLPLSHPIAGQRVRSRCSIRGATAAPVEISGPTLAERQEGTAANRAASRRQSGVSSQVDALRRIQKQSLAAPDGAIILLAKVLSPMKRCSAVS